MMMKNNQINIALQVLPKSKIREVYDIVDDAIAVIAASGLKYKVCPFETVIEGTYEKVMKVVEDVKDVCLEKGANEMLVYIKMQINGEKDVYIDDKLEKYK